MPKQVFKTMGKPLKDESAFVNVRPTRKESPVAIPTVRSPKEGTAKTDLPLSETLLKKMTLETSAARKNADKQMKAVIHYYEDCEKALKKLISELKKIEKS